MLNYKLLEDTDLVLLSGKGDCNAFTELTIRFKPFIVHVISRYYKKFSDYDDIYQLTLIALWQQCCKYDPIRSKPVAWISVVTRSIAVDFYRQSRIHNELTKESTHEPTYTQLDKLEHNEDLLEAGRHLNKIWRDLRELVILTKIHKCPFKVIGDVYKLPTGTVKSKVKRVLDRLHKEVSNDSGIK